MAEPIVSLYASARSQRPRDEVALTDLYEHIRAGTWADSVAVVREARQALDANTDPAQRAELDAAWREAKARLPAVTLSCTGITRARSAPLAERGLIANGRLQVDIDLHGQSDFDRDQIRISLLESPYLEALFLSPSGDGWKGVLRIEGAGTINRHGIAAAAAKAHLQDLIGQGNDQAVKDVQRLCYVSHDPGLLFRTDAQILRPDDDDWLAWASAGAGPTPQTDHQAAATVTEITQPITAENEGTIPEGQRYTTLLRYAGWFRRCGLERDEIAPGLRAINTRRCQPPLPDDEIQQLAAGIVGYAPDQATQATVENWAATTLASGERRLAITCFTDTDERQPAWLWRRSRR